MPYVGKKATNAVDVAESQSLTVDGDLTISDKIIHSGDTNTAIRFADADTVTVETGGSERARVASDGKVGIGLTDAASLLHVAGATADADGSLGSQSPQLIIEGGNTNNPFEIGMDNSGATAIGFLQARNKSAGVQFISLNPKGGNVGVGVATPASLIHGMAGDLFLTANSTSADSGQAVYFQSTTSGWSTSSAHAAIFGKRTDASNGYLRFDTRGSGTTAERMRILGDGTVLIGVTATGNNGAFFLPSSNSRTVLFLGTSTTSASTVQAFRNSNGTVGTISTSGSATAYNTSSDYRLKENIAGITDGINRVKQLNPSRFNFIADADTTVDGFIAHEAQTVVPEAITGTKDETEVIGDIKDADGTVTKSKVVKPETLEAGETWTETGTQPVYQGIDQAKLVPVLTAALQEAIAKIETLETKVAALEAG